MSDLERTIGAVRSQGFCVVPGAIDRAFATDLGAALSELQREDSVRFGPERIHRLGQEGFVINVGDRHPLFERLLLERPMMDVVDALVGPSAFLYLFQGVIVPPGGGIGAYPWKWHCDLYHVLRDVGDPDFLIGVNTLIFLDDVDARNGGTWLIPGSQGLESHAMPTDDPEFLRASAIQVSAPAGSALLMNPLLWHCAGTNATSAPRRAVKLLRVREWALPQMDYTRSLRAEVLAHLDAGARRLLGHDSAIPRSFDELARAERARQR